MSWVRAGFATFMGHGSIAITLDRYGHLLPGSESEAAGLLDAFFERTNTQGSGGSRLGVIVPRIVPQGWLAAGNLARGAAGVWWPIRSSKPAGRGSPTVGWFDSIAAP